MEDESFRPRHITNSIEQKRSQNKRTLQEIKKERKQERKERNKEVEGLEKQKEGAGC
jgi:hypothetical protein